MVTISEKIKKTFSGIRVKIVLTYFVIILLTLFFISVYIFTSLKAHFTNQKKIEYLTQANVIASTLYNNHPFDADVLNVLFPPNKFPSELRVIILDSDAVVVYDSLENSAVVGKALLPDEVLQALKGKDGASINRKAPGEWTYNVAVPVIKNQQNIGVVYLVSSANTTMDFINEIWRNLFLISIFVSILVGILCAIFAGVITEPIEKLTKFITSISKAGKIPKIEVSGTDEIAQLATAFNDLSDRINIIDEKNQDFVSNVSHEFKTPLSSIKLLSDSLLQMQVLDMEIVKEFLEDINNEVERLTTITSDLLEQTKLEFRQISVDSANVSLNELVGKIKESLTPVAMRKGIELVFEPDGEFHISGDFDKLWQAIYNITDNAIKYSNPDGRVEICLFQNDDVTEIFIKDSGIGIPQEEIPRIFDRFYRVDKARARETGGTGLGLSIALSAVELHKGKIDVESIVDKGTIFKISLPRELPSAL